MAKKKGTKVRKNSRVTKRKGRPPKKVTAVAPADAVNHPSHYQADARATESMEVVEVMEAFAVQDTHIATALIYLCRAGKKKDSSYVQDVTKAIWWLVRGVLFHGGCVELNKLLSTPPRIRKIIFVTK